MAHTATSSQEIPRPPLTWPRKSVASWVALGVLVGALLGYAVVRWHGLSLGLKNPGVSVEGTPGAVRTYGSLPELFAGEKGPKVSLATLPSGPGVAGVGSLTDLRGELTIVRGVTWRSYPESGRGIRTSSEAGSGESAARVQETAVKGWAPVGEGTIVGFFAKKQGERFVHAGERMHLHVVLPDLERAGHLDSATIEPRSVLRLAAVD